MQAEPPAAEKQGVWEASRAELPARPRREEGSGVCCPLLVAWGKLGGPERSLGRFFRPIPAGRRRGKASHRIPALLAPGYAIWRKGQTLSGPHLPVCKKDNSHFVGLRGRV